MKLAHTCCLAISLTLAGTHALAQGGAEGFIILRQQPIVFPDFIANLGDINGDGVDDLFLSDPIAGDSRGAGYIVYGSSQGFPARFVVDTLRPEAGGDGSAGAVVIGPDAGDNPSLTAGVSVGDVNGDGAVDLAFGAPHAALPGLRDVGLVLVRYGTGTALPARIDLSVLLSPDSDGTSGFIIQGGSAVASLGKIAAPGDLTGDGIADLVVSEDSRSYIVNGMAGNLPARIDVAQFADGDGSAGTDIRGGLEVTRAVRPAATGDFNRDGLQDFALGAASNSDAGAPPASVSVIHGRVGGFPGLLELGDLFIDNGGDGSEGTVLLSEDLEERDTFGTALWGPIDFNGDGAPDLLISGESHDPFGIPDAGSAYVIYSVDGGYPAEFAVSALRPEAGGDGSRGIILDGFEVGSTTGRTLAAGDVNGDGVDDVLIASPFASRSNGERVGEIYVFYGSRDPLPAARSVASLLPGGGGDGSAGFVIRGAVPGDTLGAQAMATADINGDGFDDIIVDAGGDGGAKRAIVIYGRDDFPPLYNIARVLTE